LKVTFLGTGTSQGIPIIACKCAVCMSDDMHDKRLRSSVLIETGQKTLVIDAGPDFRYQMLRAKVERLDAILLTHEHRDHIAGLDDVRAFNYVQQQPMDLYAEDRVLRALRIEFAYAFDEKKYPGSPEVNTHCIKNEIFQIDGIEIIPIRVMHAKLPILGFRIGDFTYLTDVNYIAEEEKEKIFGTKYLVVNALRKQTHVSHFTLGESLKLIEELSPRRAYLTHVSHQMGLHARVQYELPQNVVLAYDGLSFEMD
jgi:phosphoribosyl 1,2-cyclic phosphate phosphodiesterase